MDTAAARFSLDQFIQAALAEDIGVGDHTSCATLPASLTQSAQCIVKDTGILAGVAFAKRVFELHDPSLRFQELLADGATVKPGDSAFIVEGSARAILSAERLVLNVMQRMSGIATQTRRVADRIADTGCKILDTRKTTPLNRLIEKWAVRIGGGVNHRFGLFDMILIKDNHIDYAGGVAAALTAAHHYLKKHQLYLPIVIETRNAAEIEAVLAIGGVTRILLDNMTPPVLAAAVKQINQRFETEASGGITYENARAYAETGVNFISMGALTHTVRSLDISLKAV
jgi:nicotinate-nucleotide pyrophosphorylase (carboxylating)